MSEIHAQHSTSTASRLTGGVEKDDGRGYHDDDCPLVPVIVLLEQAATSMPTRFEREKAKMVTLTGTLPES